MTTLAYRGIITKEEFVKELKIHQKADAFLRGTYGEIEDSGFKGCAVGCSIESISRIKGLDLSIDDYGDHERYPELLGIPDWLARLEDCLFEGVSEERSKTWPVEFAEAINEGANLESVKHKFMAVILRNTLLSMDSVVFDKAAWPDVIKALALSKDAVTSMIKLHDIESKDEAAWSAAESAAWSAESAAGSAARSAAGSAARSAAWSAESAAGSAARSAAGSAARSAAWSAGSAAGSAESAAWSAAWSARSAAWSAESAESAESAAGSAENNAYNFYADELLKILKETTNN